MKKLLVSLVLAALLFTQPVYAAIAVVQQANTSKAYDTTTTVTLAFGSSVTVGNAIVVISRCVGTGSATVTITDSLSNTYTQSAIVHSVGTVDDMAIHIAQATTGGSDTITATWTITCGFALSIYEVSGLATSSHTDQVNSGADFVTAGSPFLTGSVTTTVADEILFVGSVVQGETLASATGWTAVNVADDGSGGAVDFYRIVSSTGSYQFSGDVLSNSRTWWWVYATYKGAAVTPSAVKIRARSY